MKPALSLKERGIAKPSNKPKKAAAKLNGTKPIKVAEVADVHLTAAQRRRIIGEWRELVNFTYAIASPGFGRLVMTYLKFIVAKIEPPPCVASPSDMAIDDFAQSLAKMIVELLTEILTETDDVVRKRIMSGTVLECLGPRPQADRPRTKASPYPVSPPQRGDEKKPLHEKHVYEMVDEEEFQKWLVERQAREGAAS